MFILSILGLFNFSLSLQSQSAKILIFLRDDDSLDELLATLKFGIRAINKHAWIDVSYESFIITDDTIVRTLVDNLDDSILAIMGVFTDSQVKDISPIVKSYDIPTFVLNKLNRNNREEANIYYTVPSLEFELGSFNDLLDFYNWDQVSFYLQANTSAVDVLSVSTKCWNKTIVNQDDFRNPIACNNFSIIVFIGYPPFISQALETVTCENTVVVLYVLGDVIPYFGDVLRTQKHHGDTLIIYTKPYPLLETQATSWKGSEVKPNSFKYACVDETCSTYKVRHQYHQSPSVLLMLDSLKVIENILLQYCDADTAINCRFSSTTGSKALLTEQGFSYNSLNIYKAQGVNNVDLLGYIDHENATLMDVFWYSSLSDVPIKPNNICPQSVQVPTTDTSVNVLVNSPQVRDVVRLLVVILIICMLFAEGVIFAIKRLKYKGKFRIHFNITIAVGCLDIVAASSLIIPHPLSCIPSATRDLVDFTFFIVMGYSIFLTDVRRLLRLLLPGLLYGIKIIIVIWVLRLTCSFSPAPDRYYSITLITVTLFLTLTRYKNETPVLKFTGSAFFVALAVEIVLVRLPTLPVACIVAMFTCRVVLLTAGMCAYFRYRTDRFIIDEIASFDNLLHTLKCDQTTDVTSTTTKRKLSGRYSSDERMIAGDSEFCTCRQANGGDTLDILNSNSYRSNPPESLFMGSVTEPSLASSTHALQTATYDECISKSLVDDEETPSSIGYKYAESPQLFWDNEHDLNSSLTNIKSIYENIYDRNGLQPLRIKMCTKKVESDEEGTEGTADVISLDVDKTDTSYPLDSITYRYSYSTLSDITEVDNENPIIGIPAMVRADSQEYGNQSMRLHFDDDPYLSHTDTPSREVSEPETTDAVRARFNCCIPSIPEKWPGIPSSFTGGRDTKSRSSEYAIVTGESIMDDIVLLKFQK